MNQTVCFCGETEIAYAVKHIKASWLYRILYFGGLGILLRNDLVCHYSVEIAVITQHICGHQRTKTGIDPRHQHGLFAKGFRHPLGKATGLVGIAVPYADAKRERQTVIAAAEQGTIGSGGQGGLHLFLGGYEIVVLLVVIIDYLFQSREKLVILGNVLRHGTGDEEEGC